MIIGMATPGRHMPHGAKYAVARCQSPYHWTAAHALAAMLLIILRLIRGGRGPTGELSNS